MSRDTPNGEGDFESTDWIFVAFPTDEALGRLLGGLKANEVELSRLLEELKPDEAELSQLLRDLKPEAILEFVRTQ